MFAFSFPSGCTEASMKSGDLGGARAAGSEEPESLLPPGFDAWEDKMKFRISEDANRDDSADLRWEDGSPVVASLISSVMKSGKKSLAERIVYSAIEETRTGADVVDLVTAMLPACVRSMPIVNAPTPAPTSA